MFIATRIANGIVASCLLFVAWCLFSLAPFASTLWWHGLSFAAVMLVFMGDLLFRRQHVVSDFGFAILWTLFFSCGVVVGVMKFSWDIPAVIGGPLFFALIIIFMYGMPLLLNGMYLLRLLKQRRSIA